MPNSISGHTADRPASTMAPTIIANTTNNPANRLISATANPKKISNTTAKPIKFSVTPPTLDQ